MALSLEDLRAAGASVHPVYDLFRVDNKKLTSGGDVGMKEANRIMAMWGDQIEAFKRAYGRFDLKEMRIPVQDMRVELPSRVYQMLNAFKKAEELAITGYTSAAEERRKVEASLPDPDYGPTREQTIEAARRAPLAPPKSRAERLADIQRRREMAAQSTNPRDRAAAMAALDAEEAALPTGGRKKRKTRKTRKTRKVTRRRR